MAEANSEATEQPTKARWWGEYELKSGTWARWIIGPMTFFARSQGDEWRFAWKTSGDTPSERAEFDRAVAGNCPDADCATRRFTLATPGLKLSIMPKLADRPVIVRPETPLFLPPGQQTTLYVSSGVWLVATPSFEGAPELMDIPLFHSSDTWFGHSTLQGELCYASMTNARTEMRLLAQVPHRAFTPIEISNKGKDSLAVESLRVPVTMLSLYAGKRGRLWTDKISFEREADQSAASLHITDHEEMSSSSATRLSTPREIGPTGLVHAFSRLFGKAVN